MNEMTAHVEFEQEEIQEEGGKLSHDQLALIAGGQCTTNSI